MRLWDIISSWCLQQEYNILSQCWLNAPKVFRETLDGPRAIEHVIEHSRWATFLTNLCVISSHVALSLYTAAHHQLVVLFFFFEDDLCVQSISCRNCKIKTTIIDFLYNEANRFRKKKPQKTLVIAIINNSIMCNEETKSFIETFFVWLWWIDASADVGCRSQSIIHMPVCRAVSTICRASMTTTTSSFSYSYTQ